MSYVCFVYDLSMATLSKLKLIKGRGFTLEPPGGIDQKLWNLFIQNGSILHLPAKSIIFTEGAIVDYVYVLASGFIKMTQKEKTIDIIEPGESLGAGLILNGTNNCCYPIGSETLTETEIIKIPVEKIQILASKQFEVNQFFFTQMKKRMLFLQKIKTLNIESIQKRVLSFLHLKKHLLHHEFITRKLIAEILNTTTETVIRTLNDFKNQGIIHFSGRKIIPLDTELDVKNVHQS